MSTTDNSRILKNFTKRSLFRQHLPRKTSQGIGVLGVSYCDLAFPKDTIKKRHGSYYELKPTTHKICSQIKSNDLDAIIPLRAIWHHYDEFLSKGGHIVRNGAYNVPSTIKNENASVDFLPSVSVNRLIGVLMGSCFSYNDTYADITKLWTVDYQIKPVLAQDEKLNGNCCDYDFDYVDSQGLYHKSFMTNYPSAHIGWWLPRLLGGGFTQTGVNANCYQVENYDSELVLHFTDTNSVLLGRWLFELMKVFYPNTTFELQTNEITSLNIHVFQQGSTYYGISFSNNGFSLPNISFARNYCISVTPQNTFIPVLENTTVSSYEESSSVSGKTVSFCYDSTGSGSILNSALKEIAFSIITTCLFNRSSLLGVGSLIESLGYTVFKTIPLVDYVTNYSELSNIGLQLGFQRDAVVTCLNKNLLDSFVAGTEKYVTILPFLAYQKMAERFLLPHQVLSNNSGEDSTLDYHKYDSPYYRNNLVLSKFYGKPFTNDKDAFLYATVYVASGEWVSTKTGEELATPDMWHYVVSAQQLASIFFDRGVLLDMDCFTKVWQKQDRNVTELMNASEYGVNEDGTINAKLFLLANKLGDFILHGTTDQTARQVIENHFGVNTANPCSEDDIVVLARNSEVLANEQIMNTGGAVDQSGNAMSLGEMQTIIQHATPIKNDYQTFNPDFAIVMAVHWFSVPYDRHDVPVAGLRKLDKINEELDVRKAWQIATYPEYQASGDEMLQLSDIEVFSDNYDVAWTNKNNTLKDGYSMYLGEWKTKFYKQIITPYPIYRDSNYLPSLTYAYLQPTEFDYDLHLVDKFGKAFTVAYDNYIFKKSIMTKQNYVGISGI